MRSFEKETLDILGVSSNVSNKLYGNCSIQVMPPPDFVQDTLDKTRHLRPCPYTHNLALSAKTVSNNFPFPGSA